MKNFFEKASVLLPSVWKDTALLQAYALRRIPLIAFLTPRVLSLTPDGCEIVIPLNMRSRNHFNAMYFGALATGADLALGYMVFREAERRGDKITLAFKSFEAKFLKRAEADVHFLFRDGAGLQKMIEETVAARGTKSERVNRVFEIEAITPKLGPEPVATFKLELSLKAR